MTTHARHDDDGSPWRRRCLLLSLTLFLGALAFATLGCGDTIVNVPTQPSNTVTGGGTPTPTKTTIQFRVTGNAVNARVRYATPVDGLGQVVTSLPYFLSQTTTTDSMFLSLEATPIAYSGSVFFPFLSVQIVVNGEVFREATAQTFLLNPLEVSGQWRLVK